jgi:GalNAc-alpha-(1->4)-GalNAc-alpha-(1->3)-diNAcBac-PP-undecaprenol alpha-1,4-N-acetyl-D-galactosaminyltransferase
MRPTNVAIVLPSLVGGGAERVAVDLANHWSQQSYAVTIVTIDRSDVSRYAVREDIRRVGLDLMSESRSLFSAVGNNVRRIRLLRAELKRAQSQVIFSFTDITNVTTLLACRGMKVRTIVCERTDPRHHRIGRVWNGLRNWTYGRASAIVVQTKSVGEWAKAQGWKVPVWVIPNAAPQWSVEVPQSRRERAPTILAVGRLSEEKGYHLLVEAFGAIAAQFPSWHLRIIGEGNERARLVRLINQLKLAGRVFLPGWVSDVAAEMRSAEFLALTSRYEGFPNVLLEAMAMGVPCVSFDCDSGPREIIRNGVDGLLIPPGDSRALSNAFAAMISNDARRQAMSMEARTVASRFSRADFYRRWDAVLQGSDDSGPAG